MALIVQQSSPATRSENVLSLPLPRTLANLPHQLRYSKTRSHPGMRALLSESALIVNERLIASHVSNEDHFLGHETQCLEERK